MIRDELLEIIVAALPETKKNVKFCESDSFSLMLDHCCDAIRETIESVLEG